MCAQNKSVPSGRLHRRIAVIAAVAVVVVIAAYLAFFTGGRTGAASEKRGLVIAVTFFSLKPDLDLLVCNGDSVFSITPPGVDPHEYQLTPSDVQKLKTADIIVSTAHAPFESRIKDLVDKGELGAILVEVPSVPGVVIKDNPATGQPNYHWPIYDPSNYRAFMTSVELKLEKLRPECAQKYRRNLDSILGNLSQVVSITPHLNACAVATSPLAQYAVEWTGIRVKYLLIREHDLPAIPQDIAAAENALSSGECKLVVVVGSVDTSVAQKALDMASRHNARLVIVPSPLDNRSTLDKIQEVSRELTKLATGS